jgi:pimeloyl-ACP methyl ester carboxylesterase
MKSAAAPIRLYQGPFLSIRDGLRYHYVDEGQGEPVVMVHGNPSWSIYYRNLVQALSPTHRCIVPDHIGCGFSDKPDDSRYTYTLESRIEDLETLLAHLGITENVTLVVHDWGGAIGMGWAARHPEAIKRLVILNTAAFHLPASKPFPWQLRLGRDSRLGAHLINDLNAFSIAASWVGCKRNPMSAKLRAAYQAPYHAPGDRRATLRFVQDIPLQPGDQGFDLLQNIADSLGQFQDRPMLIGWGLKDFVFDRHFLAEWEARFPQAEVHRFEDCGHYILEDAADELVPLIRTFVEQHP